MNDNIFGKINDLTEALVVEMKSSTFADIGEPLTDKEKKRLNRYLKEKINEALISVIKERSDEQVGRYEHWIKKLLLAGVNN